MNLAIFLIYCSTLVIVAHHNQPRELTLEERVQLAEEHIQEKGAELCDTLARINLANNVPIVYGLPEHCLEIEPNEDAIELEKLLNDESP